MNNFTEDANSVASTHARRAQILKSLQSVFQNTEAWNDSVWQDTVLMLLDKYYSLIYPRGATFENDSNVTVITGKNLANYEIAMREDSIEFSDLKKNETYRKPYESFQENIKNRIKTENLVASTARLASNIAVLDEDGNITGLEFGVVGDSEKAEAEPDKAGRQPPITSLNFEKIIAMVENGQDIVNMLEKALHSIPNRPLPGEEDAVFGFEDASVKGKPAVVWTDIYYRQKALQFVLKTVAADFRILVGRQGPIEIKCVRDSSKDGDRRARGVWEGLSDVFSPPVVRSDGTLDFHAFIDAKRSHRAPRINAESFYPIPSHWCMIQDNQNSTKWLRQALVKFDVAASRGVGSLTNYRPCFEYNEEYENSGTLQRVLVHAEKYEFIAELRIETWCQSVKHVGFSPAEARVTVDATGVRNIDWVGCQTFDNGYPLTSVYTEADHVLGEYIREVFRRVFGFEKQS